ncbi:MAG: SPOR domain-containing protein [Bacteroidaceae bacterium]|nr:SPOR domain-containing protein [Bacteroidaceae bacterium]
MKRLVLILFVIVSCQLSIVNCAIGQETFTERIQQSVEGQGTVVLHHDAEIEASLYGKKPVTGSVSKSVAQTISEGVDSMSMPSDSLLNSGKRIRMTGYRVQVYAGGNSRDAKRRAYQMESLVKTFFPEHRVYTRFVSPRWICHVGDFRTRDEAIELLQEMLKTGRFPEAITVKCKINAVMYE